MSKLVSFENLVMVVLGTASAAALGGWALDIRWLKIAGYAAWGLTILSLVALGAIVVAAEARGRRRSGRPKS